jgi:hypothetical protein
MIEPSWARTSWVSRCTEILWIGVAAGRVTGRWVDTWSPFVRAGTATGRITTVVVGGAATVAFAGCDAAVGTVADGSGDSKSNSSHPPAAPPAANNHGVIRRRTSIWRPSVLSGAAFRPRGLGWGTRWNATVRRRSKRGDASTMLRAGPAAHLRIEDTRGAMHRACSLRHVVAGGAGSWPVVGARKVPKKVASHGDRSLPVRRAPCPRRIRLPLAVVVYRGGWPPG